MWKLKNWALHKPDHRDSVILAVLMVVISLNPFYLHGLINFFEMGLYLPGVDAILNGQIPYRDFLHLRGPMELYFPAWWMSIAGRNFSVMPSYFYIGTLVTLIVCMMIAVKILRSRIFLYVMAFAFLARTFPRVSFSIGGGFRFAWGVASVYFAVLYFKNKNIRWLWGAGFFSALALLTSVEVGVYAFAAIFLSLCAQAWLRRRKEKPWAVLKVYVLAAAISMAPMGVYLYGHHALAPMIEAYDQIVFNMTRVFPQQDIVPHGPAEIVMAMLNPCNVNFHQMTPLYCYAGIFIYALFFGVEHRMDILCLALYGLLLFIGSMRSLWGPAFETAIQPEKLLLFFLLEQGWFWLRDSSFIRWRQITAGVLLAGILMSTAVYVGGRLQKRFYFVKMLSYFIEGKKNQTSFFVDPHPDLAAVNLPGMKNMFVPIDQAREMRQLYFFMHQHTRPDQAVLFFPDLGVYHFIVDRRFVGRFPMVTLSWVGPHWHEEFLRALDRQKPPYAVMYKQLPDYITRTQLIVPENNRKYQEVLAYIEGHYQVVSSTPSFNIWQRKILIGR